MLQVIPVRTHDKGKKTTDDPTLHVANIVIFTRRLFMWYPDVVKLMPVKTLNEKKM